MSDKWIAFNVIGEAVEKTKDLLFSPFNFSLWLKLALVVFLINGGINAGSNSNVYEFDSPADLTQNIALLIAVIVLFVAIFLFFTYIGNVAVFVFLESVLEGNVEVFDWFQKHLGRGLKLFLFNIFLLVVTLLVTLVLVLPGVGIYVSISGTAKLIALAAYGIVAIVVYLCVLIVLSVVGVFTNDFVVPFMIKNKEGIRDSWFHLLGVIKENKGQFLVYVAARILLGVATGIVSLIITVVVMIVLFIGLFIVGFIAGIAGSIIFSGALAGTLLESPPFMILLTLIILALMIFFAYIGILITLPIPVFYRYFSLLFIGKLIPEMDFFGGIEEKKLELGGKRENEKSEKELYVEVDE